MSGNPPPMMACVIAAMFDLPKDVYRMEKEEVMKLIKAKFKQFVLITHPDKTHDELPDRFKKSLLAGHLKIQKGMFVCLPIVSFPFS